MSESKVREGAGEYSVRVYTNECLRQGFGGMRVHVRVGIYEWQ